MLGRVELSITAPGQETCAQWAEQLRGLGLQRILHAPDELATQTAEAVARRLSIPTKALRALAEVDIGLWAGLTEEQLKARYPTAHRELGESALNVQPPEGENLRAAAHRLQVCLRKQISRNGVGAIGVVLRPLALAIVRCALEGRPLANLWEAAHSITQPLVIEYNRASRAAAGA